MLQARRTVHTEFNPAPLQHEPQNERRPRVAFPGKKALLLLFVTCCFGLGLLAIAQYSSIISLQYQLSSSKIRLDKLAEEYRTSKLEAAQLSALARIEIIARTELGMREPEIGQIRILTAGREYDLVTGE